MLQETHLVCCVRVVPNVCHRKTPPPSAVGDDRQRSWPNASHLLPDRISSAAAYILIIHFYACVAHSTMCCSTSHTYTHTYAVHSAADVVTKRVRAYRLHIRPSARTPFNSLLLICIRSAPLRSDYIKSALTCTYTLLLYALSYLSVDAHIHTHTRARLIS